MDIKTSIIDIVKDYGSTSMPIVMAQERAPILDEVMLIVELGLGDLAFSETGIRLLLKYGVKIVHLFARQDGLKLYLNYSGVVTYPQEAKSKKLELAQRGVRSIILDASVNNRFHNRNRVEAFAYYMLSTIRAPYPESYSCPELTVAPEHIEWAETFLNKSEGQKTIVWQMESSKAYKNLSREQSLRIIGVLLRDGWKVLVQAIGYRCLPRHKNLKELRGVSIERFMGICKLVDVVLAMDSAPAWVAAAVGAPVIAIFGPTSPMRYAIKKPNVHILQRMPAAWIGHRWHFDCGIQPCGSGCDDNRCMKDIPDSVIIDALKSPEELARWEQGPEERGRLFISGADMGYISSRDIIQAVRNVEMS